jgi:hypothetical protein
MPIPWSVALKAIPWGAILAKAPAIAKAAQTLLYGAEARKSKLPSANELQSLTDRITALEKHDLADAELLKQVTDQVEALTTVTEVLAARLRWLLTLAIISSALAVLAVWVAMSRG